MRNSLLLSLLLAASSALGGVDAVYDSEVFSERSLRLTLSAVVEGKLLRLTVTDASSGAPALPFSPVVMDAARHEMRFFLAQRNACFSLPFSQFAELQARAMERYREQVRQDDRLAEGERSTLLAKADADIAELRRSAAPRFLTLTWKKHQKLTVPCELFAVTEAGEDRGQVCLQMQGPPSKSFEVSVASGEWWQEAHVFFARGEVPVLIEDKLDGRITHRSLLRKLERRAVTPETFDVGKDCRPMLSP